MRIDRREVLLGGVGLGLAVAAGPRLGFARETGSCMTAEVVPGGGKIDQTAALQAAADTAAATGTPLFLPAGIYSTGTLNLKSGTRIEGVPGRSILRSRDGGALLSVERAETVRLAGLVLDGDAKPLGEHAALVDATDTRHLDITDCRLIGSSATGVSLRKVSGHIEDCEISDIRKDGVASEDSSGLEVAHSCISDCGGNGISVRAGSAVISGNRILDCAFSAIRTEAASNCHMIGNSCVRLGGVALHAGFASGGTTIANNFIEEATGGISVTSFSKGKSFAVIQGNQIRNLFFRHDAELHGFGIAVEADSLVTGNVIEGAPAYGIMIGWGPQLREVRVTGNRIRNAWTGIGVSIDPSAGTVRISENSIAGTKEGAIRALSGLTSIGPDLAIAGAETYRNVAVHANVAG